MPGHVDEDGERARDEDGVPDCETVETVGQVDRVARADDHEVGQGDIEPAELQDHVLDDGNDELQLRRAHRRRVEEDGPGEPGDGLQQVLVPGRHAPAAAKLAEVVEPPDRAERQGHGQHHPHEAVGEIGPQQGGDEDRDQDEHPAHGGGARLGVMRPRTVLADDLAEPAQAPNRRRPDGESDEERGEDRAYRAQREVSEDPEAAVHSGQHVEEFGQHRPPSACTTRSIPIEREPLTSTVIGDLSPRSARSPATRAS